MTKDYYRILGVLDDAEDIVIRAAYKALAQRYHPDKGMGNKEEVNARMSDINEAYGILSDLVKRKIYDSSRDKNKYSGKKVTKTCPNCESSEASLYGTAYRCSDCNLIY